MKLRFTWGNLLGLATMAAGVVVNNSAAIQTLSPVGGGKLIAASAVILGVTSNLLSHNADLIPDANKTTLGPVVLEKTGPLKPST